MRAIRAALLVAGLAGCTGSTIIGANEPPLPPQPPDPAFDAPPGPIDIVLDSQPFLALFGQRPGALDAAGRPQAFALIGTELDILNLYTLRLDQRDAATLNAKLTDCHFGFLVRRECRLVPAEES
jgi:hypothetical protein